MRALNRTGGLFVDSGAVMLCSMGRTWGWASLVAALLVITAAASAQRGDGGDEASPEPAHRLIATVITRNDHGRVFCSVWRGPEGYPTRRELNVSETLDRTIVGRRAECVFDENISPGEYALAAFHDENANNDLDRNLFGIPSEGTGASNDAYNMFAPPSYDDARFVFPNLPVHRITVRIHY